MLDSQPSYGYSNTCPIEAVPRLDESEDGDGADTWHIQARKKELELTLRHFYPDDYHPTESMQTTSTKWDSVRHYLEQLLKSSTTESVLCVVIVSSLVAVILETDIIARNERTPWWLTVSSYGYTVIYLVELAIRIFVYRWELRGDMWFRMDATIVLSDLCVQIVGSVAKNLPALSILRIFRLARLARTFKVLVMFPELYMLVRGILSALKAIFWGMILVGLTVVIWSALAVQVIHPINQELTQSGFYDRHPCDRCPQAWGSVWNASLTLLQCIIAGDSWGAFSLPIIQHSPTSILFFLGVLMSINLLIMNLILAVIVERATEAHEEDMRQSAVIRERQIKVAHAQLEKLLCQIDKNGSGTVSLSELLESYDNDTEIAAHIKFIGVGRQDLSTLFEIMDTSGDGEVPCTEFVESLHRMKSHDPLQSTIAIVKQLQSIINQIHINNGAVGHKDTNRRVMSPLPSQMCNEQEDAMLKSIHSLKSELAQISQHAQQQAQIYSTMLESLSESVGKLINDFANSSNCQNHACRQQHEVDHWDPLAEHAPAVEDINMTRSNTMNNQPFVAAPAWSSAPAEPGKKF